MPTSATTVRSWWRACWSARGSGPMLRRPWTVPPTVLDALLGGTGHDPALADVLVEVPAVPCEEADRLRCAFDAGARLTYLRERAGGLAPSRAQAALGPVMGSPFVLDLALVLPAADVTDLVRTALRDAQLTARGLVVGPVDDVPVEQVVPALRLLARSGWPVVLHGARPWDPAWTSQVPVEVDVTSRGGDSRELLWQQALEQGGVPEAPALAVRLAHLRLGSVQVVRAVSAAALAAAADGVPVSYDALVRGAQRQNGSGLERLARRIRPQAGPDDLVLPDEPRRLLAELVARFRHRDALRAYGVGGPSSISRGVTALFGGPPGTGKTLAVEVLAHELGVDVYAVDLSTVVDKYVGETEKNLERIFTQAAGVNGVLFFDEADALFGRRGQVSEAKDRHANLGVAYLLQRLEDFDGLAVLATNLRSNLDEAFARRIDVIVDFPRPDAVARRALFAACLGRLVPRDPDLDLDALARFDLSGGEIRNVAVTAVTVTAAARRTLTTLDLVRAVQQEYRKLGRLTAPADFAAWSGQLAST